MQAIDNSKKIKELEAQIRQLQDEEHNSKFPPVPSALVQEIATDLHNTMCRYNHTDGCS